jgi:hypothetical protein
VHFAYSAEEAPGSPTASAARFAFAFANGWFGAMVLKNTRANAV